MVIPNSLLAPIFAAAPITTTVVLPGIVATTMATSFIYSNVQGGGIETEKNNIAAGGAVGVTALGIAGNFFTPLRAVFLGQPFELATGGLIAAAAAIGMDYAKNPSRSYPSAQHTIG